MVWFNCESRMIRVDAMRSMVVLVVWWLVGGTVGLSRSLEECPLEERENCE